MGDEVDEVSDRNDAIVRRRGGRLQKDFSLMFILIVLVLKVVHVGAVQLSAPVKLAVERIVRYAGSRLILYCRLDLLCTY